MTFNYSVEKHTSNNTIAQLELFHIIHIISFQVWYGVIIQYSGLNSRDRVVTTPLCPTLFKSKQYYTKINSGVAKKTYTALTLIHKISSTTAVRQLAIGQKTIMLCTIIYGFLAQCVAHLHLIKTVNK